MLSLPLAMAGPLAAFVQVVLIDVALAGSAVRLPLRLLPTLPRGTVGLPLGVEGMAYAEAGATIKLSRVNAA